MNTLSMILAVCFSSRQGHSNKERNPLHPTNNYARGHLGLQCRCRYAACTFSDPRRVQQIDGVMLNLHLVKKLLLFFSSIQLSTILLD